MRFPDDLLSWLHDVQREETSLDRARRAAQANPTDMQPRYALARALANTGHFEDATTEYVWLWQHMLEHEPAKVGVEGSFMLGEIARLMSEHPPARKRFDNLRDTVLGDAPPANVTGRVVLDWIDLRAERGPVAIEAQRLSTSRSRHAPT